MTENCLTLCPATTVADLEGVRRAPLPQKDFHMMAKNYSLLYQLCSGRIRCHDQRSELDNENLFG
jgi:hypothetical protein